MSGLRKIFKGRRFTYFLTSLVIFYLIVWFVVFHGKSGERSDRSDSSPAEDDPRCNCPSLAQQRQEREDTLDEGEGEAGEVASREEWEEQYKNLPRFQRYGRRKFIEGEAKMVLILAYQRVGSSFFGKIFDMNPDIFYVYEPLDSLYQAMFGTGSGFNIPSDITSLRNGTDRVIPQDEIEAVTSFLTDILSCRLQNLPTEFFVHSFWSFLANFMPSWEPYQTCLEEVNLAYGRNKCAPKLRCPKRFGMQPWRSQQCKAKLWDKTDKNTSVLDYLECMDKIRSTATKCIELMLEKCKGTGFRAAKTVRATMQSVESLITTHKNLRVIHLLREPRPVAASRMTTQTYQGLYARNGTIRESRVYCSIVMRDLRLRRELERKHPGVFYEVLYEDFVKQPAEYAKSVYNFLDMNIPESLVPWVQNKTRGAATPSPSRRPRVPRWKRVVTVDESERILEVCKDFYDTIDYDFS